jgi:hypothetical protein
LQIIDSETGLGLSPTECYFNLKKLVESAQEAGSGLGIMTAENRDIWYETYSSMCKSKLKNFILIIVFFRILLKYDV